jgi:hypothetical protein
MGRSEANKIPNLVPQTLPHFHVNRAKRHLRKAPQRVVDALEKPFANPSDKGFDSWVGMRPSQDLIRERHFQEVPCQQETEKEHPLATKPTGRSTTSLQSISWCVRTNSATSQTYFSRSQASLEACTQRINSESSGEKVGHLCQEAPTSTAATALFKPRWASLVTSLTPQSPRATNERKKALQKAPSSLLDPRRNPIPPSRRYVPSPPRL